MFGASLFANLMVATIKLMALGIFFISAAILYFSKGLARLIENVYKAYKVEKANKQKELEKANKQKELKKLKENLDNQQLQNLDKKIIDKLKLEKVNKQKELQNKKR